MSKGLRGNLKIIAEKIVYPRLKKLPWRTGAPSLGTFVSRFNTAWSHGRYPIRFLPFNELRGATGGSGVYEDASVSEKLYDQIEKFQNSCQRDIDKNFGMGRYTISSSIQRWAGHLQFYIGLIDIKALQKRDANAPDEPTGEI